MSKEAFVSAAKLGVPSSYNSTRYSAIFHGIQVAIDDAAAEAGRDPIVNEGESGVVPPTEYPDAEYPDLRPGDIWIDANGGLNVWYNDQWNQATVYSDNVLPSGNSPLLRSTEDGTNVNSIITPNDEEFFNQAEYNEWLYTRTDRRPIVTDQGAPTIHPDFPAYELREGDYWIDKNHRLYYWNKDSDAWIPVDAGGGRLPIFAPDEPTEHPDYNAPDNELKVGDYWYDSDNGFKQYIYDGNEWVAITPDRDVLDDRYLVKTGDTMTGNLKLENKDIVIDKADGSEQLRIHSNTSSYFTNIHAYNGGGIRFRASAGDSSSPYTTLISISNDSQNIGGTDHNTTLALNRVRTPNNDDQAANKWYVDNAISNVDLDGYLPLDGGTLTGALSIDLAENKALRIYQDGTEQAQIWADGTFQTAKTSFGPNHLVTKTYVDDAFAPFQTAEDVSDAIDAEDVHLRKTGGTLTGSFSINKGEKPHAQWKITPNGGDNYATNIYNLGNGEMRFRTSHTDAEAGHKGSHIVLSPNGGNPETKIYNVVPAGDTTAVPKSYVDNAVASVSAPPTGPATLAWEWKNDDSLFDPGEGKVAWYSTSQFYRLNLKSANGVDLGKNRIAPKDHSFSNKLYGSVWAYVNGGWQLIKMFDIGRIQWNKNDCIWVYSSTTHFGSNNFTAGQKYYFTVGGFF